MSNEDTTPEDTTPEPTPTNPNPEYNQETGEFK